MPPSQKEALQKQIAAHTRRLQLLKERQAKEGIKTDPAVITEIEGIEAKIVELQAELEALPQIIRQNPYRGLSAFREEDEDVFFGRETFTTQLVESMQQKPLVAVLGPSGSGKSSIVFAGLIPALRHQTPPSQAGKGAGGEGWLIASFRPGSDPFMGLASALVALLDPDMSKSKQIGEARDLATRLREERSPLSDYIDHLHQTYADHRLLLIADQFEELYTLTQETTTRQKFLDLLLTTVDTNASVATTGLQLLLTLRADFLGQALLNPPFSDVLQDNIRLLGPMSPGELRMAIEKPTEQRGASLEPGLVERILDDVKNEPGNLPLLEFALTKLWEQQQQGQLTHAAYQAIGQVEGALSCHADKVFEGLSEADQEQARRLFLRLVQPGEGAEDTRRLVTKAELGEATWSLVQRLADERLLVTDRDPDEQETVEIAHEALITGWERLQDWIEADHSFLTWQKGLRFALEQWQTSEQDEGALLRGALLAEAEACLGERGGYLGQAQRDFIQAGIALRERERHREKDYRKLRLVSEIVTQGAKGRNLSGADLEEADLSGANLEEANLNEANLSGTNLRDADLEKANLNKANLSGADLNWANLGEANLGGADLSEAELRGAYLRNANLKKANLNKANLINAELFDADLSGTNLIEAKLSRADLSRADLSGANLSGTYLGEAYLSKADLSRADLSEANLSVADLSVADLSEANLSEADLSGANLSGANLNRVDLSETRIDNETQLDDKWKLVWEIVNQGAESRDLSEADLSGAKLSGADLFKARYTEATKWPEGFTPPPDAILVE